MFIQQLRPALFHLAVLTVITGLIYPLVPTALASLIFPKQAHGSLITTNNKITGSEWIGQAFDDPKYFWSRPSATSPGPYNAASSSGSNYGPFNPDLKKAIAERRTHYPANPPMDLLTASASGLDPHISPEAAHFQAERVAKTRNLPQRQITALVNELTEPRQLGFLGDPRVNVLKLNLKLDQLK